VTTPPFDEARDATRRTRLANERTYMAWVRSGLAAFAVSLGAGKLIPELSGGSDWPFEAIGVGFGLLGVAFIVYGYVRQRNVERALRRGEYAPPDDNLTLVLTGVGVVLGVATVVLILVSG
jgi:inner membrane protein YidH